VGLLALLADEVSGVNAATSPPRMLCGKSKPPYTRRTHGC